MAQYSNKQSLLQTEFIAFFYNDLCIWEIALMRVACDKQV